MKSIWIIVAIIAVFGLGFWGIKSLSGQTTPTNTTNISQTSSVTIKNMAFSPTLITTSIGQTITFTNNDSVPHTATATDKSFDSGSIAPGATFNKTFNSAGSFSYYCSFHPTMKGKVIVK
jgi:plastocyanin